MIELIGVEKNFGVLKAVDSLNDSAQIWRRHYD